MSQNTKIPKDLDIDKFIRSIDENVELKGLRVVFFDGQQMEVLREGPPVCDPDLMTIVIRIQMEQPTLHSAEAAQGRDGRFYSELLGGVLNCSAAAIGWAVVGSSSAAAPVTGGSSTFIAVLAWSATAASSVQCGNSAYRLYNEVANPKGNEWIDSQEWYTTTETVLDVLSVLGAAASAGATIKMAIALRRSTGKTMLAVLKGLTRSQRKLLAEEIIRAENPGISNSSLKMMVSAGTYPKRFTNLQISTAVRHQLKDALGAAISFTGSASSGAVKKLVVGVAKSFETY